MMTECFFSIAAISAAAAILLPFCLRYNPQSTQARWLRHGVIGVFLLAIWNALPMLPPVGMNPLSVTVAGSLGIAGAVGLALLH